MTKLQQMDSIGELRACMTALGIHLRAGERQTRTATIRHTGAAIMPGEIDANFELLDMSNGPEISCDADIIKGYGIMFPDFKPWFQKFSFDKENCELRICSQDWQSKYDFNFCF